MRIYKRTMAVLFGPECPDGCGVRVYKKDVQWHRAEHCQLSERNAA